jgi:endoglucanase
MAGARRRAAIMPAVMLTLVWLWTDVGGAFAEDDVPLSLHVAGNQLVNGVGRAVHIQGVNRSGTEYACIQGWGIFDGPSNEASVRAIADWHVNAVRLPLNEDCWLGINGVSPAHSAASYQTAVTDYVRLLHSNGQFVELSLVWVGPGAEPATSQLPMPDADHAPEFWRSVATAFRDDPAVFFGVYGEPHDISWSCWRDGGPACPTPYRAAGMQSLVDAIRSTGARQPIAVPGIDWANDLSSWLDHKPLDLNRSLVAEAHIYNFNACRDLVCWQKTVLPVAKRVPVVTSEVGEDDCKGAFMDAYLPFARRNGISYMAWAWNTWKKCTALITSYEGIPTPYGFVYRENLAQPTPATASDSAPARGVAGVPHLSAPAWAGLAVALVIGPAVALVIGRRRRRLIDRRGPRRPT